MCPSCLWKFTTYALSRLSLRRPHRRRRRIRTSNSPTTHISTVIMKAVAAVLLSAATAVVAIPVCAQTNMTSA